VSAIMGNTIPMKLAAKIVLGIAKITTNDTRIKTFRNFSAFSITHPP
jgi:hypothetical protein